MVDQNDSEKGPREAAAATEHETSDGDEASEVVSVPERELVADEDGVSYQSSDVSVVDGSAMQAAVARFAMPMTASEQLQRAVKALRSPLPMAESEQLQRALKAFEGPLGIADALGSFKHTLAMGAEMQRAFDADVRRLLPMREITQTLRDLQVGMQGPLGVLHELTSQISRALAPAVAVADVLGKSLRDVLRRDDATRWVNALQQVVAPHFATLAQQHDGPVGVLSMLDDAAFMSWSHRGEGEEEYSVSMAALVPPMRPPTAAIRRLQVDCSIVCSICRTALLVRPESEIISDDEVQLSFRVFPFCPVCTKAGADDPSFWADNLQVHHSGGAVEDAPEYELVKGDAEGDGVPLGVLRLVTKDDGDDDAR